jgi:hypothetical protein
MSELFVVRNQLGHYWGKKKRWVDGTRPARVLTCKHRDEGLNLLVELSSRDVDLRGEVVAAPVNERGLPQVEPSKHRLQDADDLVADANAEAAVSADDTAARDETRT